MNDDHVDHNPDDACGAPGCGYAHINIFGVPVPAITTDIVVTDVLVIAFGTHMESGDSTYTIIGSGGLDDCRMIGAFEQEAFRLKMMGLADSLRAQSEDDED